MRAGDVVADRFELERLAGAGAMGEVYRARDRIGGGLVALKILREARSDAPRFEREARALAELRHPHIVRYAAHGSTPGGGAWLAMEWLEGETLAARLDRASLTTAESIELAVRAAEALGAAHARGIVHRDLKPGNMLLCGGEVERLKLLDFGIARLRKGFGLPTITGTGVAIGTPGYMAPEQARGERDIDARADVFALGCVLYKCLTGVPAFAGENVLAILAKIVLDEPPRLDAVAPEAPRSLVDLVARMLSKDRADRPRDGAAVAEQLRRLGEVPPFGRLPRSDPAPALTSGEQRLLTVVLGRAAAPAWEPSDPDAPTSSAPGEAYRARLRAALAPTGAHVEVLADGSVLGKLAGAALPEQAARAARCALSLRDAANASIVAVATGRGRANEPWPAGEAIDRATEMLERAPGESIVLDALTAGVLEQRFELGASDGALLLIRERPFSEHRRTLLGRTTPCVGRERELVTLEAFWDECAREGIARAVLLTAPAGVGKTRVTHELVARLRARGGAEIWIGRADPVGAGAPLGAVADALRHAADVQDAEPLELRRDKIAARVRRHVAAADAERVAAFLGELMGAPFPDATSPVLAAARRDPKAMADETRLAFEDFVIAECTARPILLVLEDLHWGDLRTLELLEGMLRDANERPWMVLATARSDIHDRFPDLRRAAGIEEMRLSGIARKASEKLVREVLGRAVDGAVVTRIVDRAGGNALFLEELIRATFEGKGDSVPETVLGILEARLEEVGIEGRRVLRAASVYGKTFWRGALRALLGGAAKTAEVDDYLELLTEMELIQPSGEGRFPGERSFAFRHDLVRDAAYATLTAEDRQLGHELAGAWLAAAGERDAMVLAEHFEKGGERERAAAAFVDAARQSLASDDLAGAVARAERGVDCGAQGEVLGRLRGVQAEAHYWAGDNAARERCATEAVALLPAGTEEWFEAMKNAIFANVLLGRGERVEELVGLVRTVPAPAAESARARILARSAGILLILGNRRAANETVDAIDESAIDDLARAFLHQTRAELARFDGEMSAQLREFERATALFDRIGNRRHACVGRIHQGFARALCGDYERAERLLREAIPIAERLGGQLLANAAYNNLGLALAGLGRLDEARRAEERAARDYDAVGNRRMGGNSRIYLSRILLRLGDARGALAEGCRAVDLLEISPPLVPYALATVARAQLALGDVGAAREAASRAMRRIQEIGVVDEGEELVRLADAETLLASGDDAGARAAIAAARARLLDRASKIGDENLRTSFLTRVEENARTLELARAAGVT